MWNFSLRRWAKALLGDVAGGLREAEVGLHLGIGGVSQLLGGGRFFGAGQVLVGQAFGVVGVLLGRVTLVLLGLDDGEIARLGADSVIGLDSSYRAGTSPGASLE